MGVVGIVPGLKQIDLCMKTGRKRLLGCIVIFSILGFRRIVQMKTLREEIERLLLQGGQGLRTRDERISGLGFFRQCSQRVVRTEWRDNGHPIRHRRLPVKPFRSRKIKGQLVKSIGEFPLDLMQIVRES